VINIEEKGRNHGIVHRSRGKKPLKRALCFAKKGARSKEGKKEKIGKMSNSCWSTGNPVSEKQTWPKARKRGKKE